MELQAVMEKRRSIRNYNPERKVTKEQLEELIKAASYAPSWKNLQTSRYYCVLSENAVKELREKCLPEFNQANSEGAGAYIVTTFVKGMVGFDKNTGSPVTAGAIMTLVCRMIICFLKLLNWGLILW
jgi:nitroreductase